MVFLFPFMLSRLTRHFDVPHSFGLLKPAREVACSLPMRRRRKYLNLAVLILRPVSDYELFQDKCLPYVCLYQIAQHVRVQ